MGNVATYTCLPGYELVGQQTRVCESIGSSTGVWSGEPPLCSGNN